MRKLSNILLVIGILGLFLGLSGVGDEWISGFALAIGAVAFILTYLIRMIEKAEATR